jgi:hypothetical protein
VMLAFRMRFREEQSQEPASSPGGGPSEVTYLLAPQSHHPDLTGASSRLARRCQPSPLHTTLHNQPPPSPSPLPSLTNKHFADGSQLRTVSPHPSLPVLCRTTDAGQERSTTLPRSLPRPQYKGIRSSTKEPVTGIASADLFLRKTAAPLFSKWTSGTREARPHYLHHPWNRSAYISCDGGNEEL